MSKYFLYLLGIIFSLQSFAQPSLDSLPQEYQQQYQAAMESYEFKLMDDSVDFALHPIDLIPPVVSYNITPTNPAIEYYNLDFPIPQKNGFIFVLDTEERSFHHDLNNGILSQFNYNATRDPSSAPCQGHGTFVLGQVIGENFGLLRDYAKVGFVKGALVKSLRSDGTGSYSELLAALEYVYKVAPQLQRMGYVVVVNMSLGGGGKNAAISRIIAKLRAINVPVFAATGNDGSDSIISFPANDIYSIACGSVHPTDLTRSWFSNAGQRINYTSIGEIVYGTTCDDSYEYSQGTSMSTPHVAAMYLYNAMNSKSTKIDSILALTPKLDLYVDGWDTHTGSGMLLEKKKVVQPVPEEPQEPTIPDTTLITHEFRIFGAALGNPQVRFDSKIAGKTTKATIEEIVLEVQSVKKDPFVEFAYLLDLFKQHYESRGIIADSSKYTTLDWAGILMSESKLFVSRRTQLPFKVKSMTITVNGITLTSNTPLFEQGKLNTLDVGLVFFNYN